MKKIAFLSLFLWPLITLAQQIDVSGTSVTFNSQGRVIFPLAKSNVRVWVEPGDGSLLTSSFSSYSPINNTIIRQPLMLSTALYDTTRGRFSTSSGTGSLGLAPKLPAMPTGSSVISMVSSTPDIVPADSMVFGIQYSLTDMYSNYYVVFYYNSINTFIPQAANGSFTSGNANFNMVRTHGNEAVAFNNNQGYTPAGTAYSNAISFSLPKDTGMRSLFITLVPQAELTIGAATSVLAVLIKKSINRKSGKLESIELGRSEMNGMGVASAHDPNNLIVSPTCLNLPVAVNWFNYTVNFQNMGKGPSDKVLIKAQLPAGLDWGSFQQGEVVFAGVTYQAGSSRIKFTPTMDAGAGTVDFLIEGLNGQVLEGAAAGNNTAASPATMGHVLFRIKSTAGTGPALKSLADIYLKSVASASDPGELVKINGIEYEKPVRTNTAVSNYEKDCAKKKDTGSNEQVKSKCDCKHPSGIMCWITCYWWVALIILLILLLLILRKRKK